MTIENLGELLDKTEEKYNKSIDIIKNILIYLKDAQLHLEEWHFDGYDPQLDLLIAEIENKLKGLDI